VSPAQPNQAACLYEAFDATSQGKALSLQDFVSAMAVVTRGSVQQKLRLAFSIYDATRSGYLSLQEVSAWPSIMA
jgi:Ca2+-binding EF-hand superfamily protein